MKRIFVNEDNGHFYFCHPSEEMTNEGVDRLVDFYARGTQVQGILFCANVQRALFASNVWERLYQDYDPDGGSDQPCLQWLKPKERELRVGSHGRQWIHNLWLLEHRGVDHLGRWLARCRHHGIEGWLTMRMNDCHYNQEAPDAFWHSTLWKTRPDLYRAPYREERSWERAFDYGKKEVREHHMKFIRELLERYDMFGLELDWLRWGMDFAPGHERAGRAILTDFMREVRQLADACAARVGHPVWVGVRVPAEPQSCLALGYDVTAWARERLVDQVVVSGMGNVANFDFPVEWWRLVLGERVRLLALAEGALVPYPAYGKPVGHDSIWFGCAASVLHRGVDGVYLFNACYMESSAPDRFHELLCHLGDVQTLANESRRHVVTYPQNRAAGESARTVLPISLKQTSAGYDFGRMEDNISIRVHVGPAPKAGRAVLHLGFSPDTPRLDPAAMVVRVNGVVALPCKDRPKSGVEVNEIDWAVEYSDRIGQMLNYEIPLSAMQDDTNMVEFVPPSVQGELRWVEISIMPPEA